MASAEKKQIQTFTEEMQLEYKQGQGRFNLFSTIESFWTNYLKPKVAALIVSGSGSIIGSGTQGVLSKIKTVVSGNITELEDSHASETSTSFLIDYPNAAIAIDAQGSSISSKSTGAFTYNNYINCNPFGGNIFYAGGGYHGFSGGWITYIASNAPSLTTANRPLFLDEYNRIVTVNTVATGSFTSQDGKTVTVSSGLIVSIV